MDVEESYKSRNVPSARIGGSSEGSGSHEGCWCCRCLFRGVLRRSDADFRSSGDFVSFEAYLWRRIHITNAPRIILIDEVESSVKTMRTRYPYVFWSIFIQWTDPDPFRIF